MNVNTSLTLNGSKSLSQIEREMVKMFEEVGTAFKTKRNKSVIAIQAAMRDANQVIYEEALLRAPVIRPEIFAKESKRYHSVHLGSREHMIERSAVGKKWIKQGIIARRVVTFRDPASEYAAAVEYGRSEFLQVASNRNGLWLRTVGAMEAQPFLRPAQKAKAQEAVNVFTTSLSNRWLKVLSTLNRRKRK